MTDIMDLFPDRVMPEPNSGCWLWLGSASRYPTLAYNQRGHRLSYALSRGPIPAGQQVMHRCDTKLCVNPAHLELGTNAQNVKAAYDRGLRRRFRGANSPSAKLTPQHVAEIRSVAGKFAYGQAKAFAERFGVTVDAIKAVKYGRTWC